MFASLKYIMREFWNFWTDSIIYWHLPSGTDIFANVTIPSIHMIYFWVPKARTWKPKAETRKKRAIKASLCEKCLLRTQRILSIRMLFDCQLITKYCSVGKSQQIMKVVSAASPWPPGTQLQRAFGIVNRRPRRGVISTVSSLISNSWHTIHLHWRHFPHYMQGTRD